jgi:hypothetical protein
VTPADHKLVVRSPGPKRKRRSRKPDDDGGQLKFFGLEPDDQA